MTDHDKLRAFAQGIIEERDRMVDEVGLVGASIEVARAGTAEKLIELLDSLPPAISPDRIPARVREALDRYAEGGIRTGSCMQAVLEGDLFAAFGRADFETMLALPAIMVYLRNNLPPGSYGSAEVGGALDREAKVMSSDKQPQTMPEDEWQALGLALFGDDRTKWRFRCPHCDNVMSIEKARAMQPEQIAMLRASKWNIEQECIGRHIDAGCDWCAYGLFSGPFFVVRDGGRKTPVFGFDTSGSAP